MLFNVCTNIHARQCFYKLNQSFSTLLITSGSLSKFSSISHSQPSQFMCSKLISELIPPMCRTPIRLLRGEPVENRESESLAEYVYSVDIFSSTLTFSVLHSHFHTFYTANFLSKKTDSVFTSELRRLRRSEVFPFFLLWSLPCRRCSHPQY